MLCLGRKKDEKILIGDDIVITVVRISPGYVRLGIKAPENLRIIRPELLDKENDSE